MPDSSWLPRVPFIDDGEPVDQNVSNRPSVALAGQTQYLKDRLDAAALGESTRAFGAVLASAVLPNQPVAWNAVTEQFEPALASVAPDPVSGSLVAGPLADCVGICSDKSTPTYGTIVTGGRFATNLANAVSGTPTVGRYYLSSSVAGTLTTQRPAVSVPVLYWDGTYAYVAPSLHQFLESHVHYRFALPCAPAGGQVAIGGHVAVTSPDATKPGWLPAAHASFNGKAPTGASYGYNLAVDPNLSKVWPPTPIESAVFVWDKGLDDTGGTVLPTGLNGLVYGNRYGIWWMSDCVGDTPWPASYDPAHPPVPAGPNSSLGAECPRLVDMRLFVAFTEMLFLTDKSVVTSLTPAAGSAITVADCAGNPARTGDLQLGLNFALLTGTDVIEGPLVYKTLAAGVFHRGNVVEKLVAGANVTLTPTVTNAHDGSAQGTVLIDVDVDLASRELAPQVIRLQDARERFLANVPYIGFPPDRPSAITAPFAIPPIGLPTTPTIVLRVQLLGTTAGTLPALTVVFRRISRPVPAATPLALPLSDTTLPITTTLAVGANQYVEATSSPVTIATGDTFLITFSRAGGDGYTGEVGLLRLGAVIGGS